MKEKKVLEKFRKLLAQKRNEYIAKMNEYGSDSYYDYCRGKKDLIEDIVAYLANELNE
jgi:hypothetical protein